jgi:hypothetical protein
LRCVSLPELAIFFSIAWLFLSPSFRMPHTGSQSFAPPPWARGMLALAGAGTINVAAAANAMLRPPLKAARRPPNATPGTPRGSSAFLPVLSSPSTVAVIRRCCRAEGARAGAVGARARVPAVDIITLMGRRAGEWVSDGARV